MASTNVANQFTEDDEAWNFYIGKELDTDSSPSAYDAKFFSGYIYEIGFSNNDIHHNSRWTSSGCSGHCSDFCDTESNTCLSTCEIDEFPLNDNDQTCGTCDASCTEGCVRYDHCGLCHSYECAICDGFESGDNCTGCYAGKTDGTAAPNCQCNDYPTGQWYSTVTDACQQCHANCDTCFYARLSRESLVDCSNNCITNYEQHRGICEEWCPTGYTANTGAKTCTDTTVPADHLVLHYGDFTLFQNTDTDQAGGLVAFRGVNNLFNDVSTDA